VHLPPFFPPVRDHLPTRTTPFVNYALIAANIAVFVLQAGDILSGDDSAQAIVNTWGLVPARFAHNPVFAFETIFTSMFMHGGIAHIFGNMLFLWIFGDNVEDGMGHARYLVFYLLGGIGAAAAQVLIAPASPFPMVGASGAISAVLAGYVLLYPRAPITVFNPILFLWLFLGIFLTFPAWLEIGLFFVINLAEAMTNAAQGGVAFMAHVGGFLAGLVLLRPFMAGREHVRDYARWEQWARRRQRGAW
jgi:membrane associated rhomboid family serine protease